MTHEKLREAYLRWCDRNLTSPEASEWDEFIVPFIEALEQSAEAHPQLALEREITAMLREALKDAKCQCFIRGDQVGKHEIEQALAREKEMRK